MKNQKISIFRIIFGIFTLLILAGLILIIKQKNENGNTIEVLQETDQPIQETENQIQAEQEELDATINDIIPGVVCWGDSLTAGAGGEGTSYPSVLQSLIAKYIYEIPVINMGVGGENVNTIIGRAGGVPFVVEAFAIPSDTSPVEIKLRSANGSSVAPLRQGDKGVNECFINNIAGTISIEQESYTSEEFTYYFSRTTPGESIDVSDGTKVITSGSLLYNEYIPIIFIGQNGGWEDYDDLISKQMSIVKTHTKNKDKFIILGLTTGTREDRVGLEVAMSNAYGRKYINLREYLSSEGMYASSLIPTEEDLEAMAIGSVPGSLLSDKKHLNAAGYMLIGNIVYERMCELGYFDDVLDVLNSTCDH
jgi:hypothetical protein